MAMLITHRLTRRFGQFTAVNAVDLELQEGEVIGLLGPNGAGKTTMIKMLTTLLPPTDGEAWIGGLEIRRQAAAVRRIIGYVPQAISADGTLTGRENLAIFAKLYDIRRSLRDELVREALDFMGLSDAADRMVRTYSGGMIRRLEIAQSMLHRPKLLFLDEPTIGLDPLARAMVWERVRQLCQSFGTTIFLTTHLMDEADGLCSRIAIMSSGRVVAIGTAAQLKASLAVTEPTLNEVFIHFTGGNVEQGGGYREAARARRTVRRLG